MHFVKMHGCGNDFMIFDDRAASLDLSASRIVGLADRRRGVGFDQLVVLSQSSQADVFMRIYNPDGSEAGACGNATRCVAALLGRPHLAVETIAGVLPCVLTGGRVVVDMGPALLGWREVPLSREMDTLHVTLAGDPAACSMGNPHVTFFTDVGAVDAVGPAVEHDPLFPERVNVGFARVLGPERIRLRVWERGAGLTLACGSGACAALVNAARRGLTARRAIVVTDGGELDITWRADGHVSMAGPAVTSYTGDLELEQFS